jgi:hypothetical protein
LGLFGIFFGGGGWELGGCWRQSKRLLLQSPNGNESEKKGRQMKQMTILHADNNSHCS